MSGRPTNAGINPLARPDVVRAGRRTDEAAAKSTAAVGGAGADASESKVANVELLEGLAAFVVDSGFLDDVSAFVSETASELSSTGKLCESDNGEGVDHHAWTAYQELVKLADRKLEGFIRSLAMPAKEFQVACQQLIDAGAWVTVDGSKLRASAFLRAFTATWDFEKFIGLVVEEQNRRAPTGRTLGNHSP